jgi:putative membrane protein
VAFVGACAAETKYEPLLGSVGYARLSGRISTLKVKGIDLMRLLLHWILNAVALLIVSHFVEGFVVSSVVSALIAVIVIGLFNATLGLLLKIITLPLGILTFGIFFLVVNAVILWFSSKFVPGFAVTTFKAAFLGALALAVLHLLFGFVGKAMKRS